MVRVDVGVTWKVKLFMFFFWCGCFGWGDASVSPLVLFVHGFHFASDYGCLFCFSVIVRGTRGRGRPIEFGELGTTLEA